MWQSLTTPAGFAQKQANLLANAQDEAKGLEVPAGFKVEPVATFQNVRGEKSPIILWKVTYPDGTFLNRVSLDGVKALFAV